MVVADAVNFPIPLVGTCGDGRLVFQSQDGRVGLVHQGIDAYRKGLARLISQTVDVSAQIQNGRGDPFLTEVVGQSVGHVAFGNAPLSRVLPSR